MPQLFTLAQERWAQLPGANLVDVNPSGLAAITLPSPGMHLNKVMLTGGAHAGDYSLMYDGQAVAHFPVMKSGYAEYDVDWVVKGTTISVAVQGTNGTAPVRVELLFSNSALQGAPPISAYRAIFFSSVQAAANAFPGVAITAVNYDVGPAAPRAVLATAEGGTYAGVTFPAVGGYQGGAAAAIEGTIYLPTLTPAPQLQPTISLAPLVFNQAATTLQFWVFY